ncbi:TonB-dependent receptor [Marinibactrum halimedae]|uniref:TonB-dependent receptor n=1 Tax=Marinibactrum halimedae TaxID=1444977 RepID=A0AA37T5V2_9GAMM|nr:TonB-dependent receptor [Marinibactrum halimedae]MCD9458427.1 TonB-dependent receptor [Marinibactrum halimedae]GLS26124.1 TonB-dependent receptor [Marinibactrum halimedae]
MSQTPWMKSALALSIASTIATTIASHSYAQDDQPHRTLEEVVVTAQKRTESLQDVPISISAVSGEKLADAGIEKIEDIISFIPNIHMTESGLSTQLRIRGMGSGNNQAFEQSVGQYVDGVYYGRPQLLRAPFLDLASVEVLRGPQSVLFGKNSIAGAINMRTARPTDEFEGFISANYAPAQNQQELTGVVSGPITDTLRARLALRSYTEDGWMENTLLDKDSPARDEQSARLTLDWTPTDSLSLSLKLEQNTFDGEGRQLEIIEDNPSPQSLSQIAGVSDPNTAAFLDQFPSTYSNIASVLFNQPAFEAEQNFERQANVDEFSNNDMSNYTFNAEYQLGENTLNWVTGWVEYEYDELCDCDFTSADSFQVFLNEEFEQFSQEIRITSPTGGTVEWIAGAFYQEYDMTYDEDFIISDGGLLATAVNGRYNNLIDLGNFGTRRLYEQTSEAWSVFAQATWNISDTLRLTLGGRFTEEDKEGARSMTIVDFSDGSIPAAVTDSVNCSPGTFTNISETFSIPCVINNVFGVDTQQASTGNRGNNLVGDRTEREFTPLVNLQWDATDDLMVYAAYTEGFKAGGFDTRSNSNAVFEFEDEGATAYEIGFKSSLFGGEAELNGAFFYTEYDNLQVSQFDGAIGFNVVNAAESVIQGFELDGRWAATDYLTVSYGLAYNDFEYTNFPVGGCYQGETPNGIDIDGDGTLDTCDYTGRSGTFAPKKTFNLGAEYIRPITSDINFRSLFDAQYVDNHDVHENQDPKYDIDPYTTVNLRVGIESESWAVALVGKNLTDESVLTYVSNAPLSDSVFGTNTYYGFLRRPRSVAVEGTYRF